jgi:hypothetical protein
MATEPDGLGVSQAQPEPNRTQKPFSNELASNSKTGIVNTRWFVTGQVPYGVFTT